MPPDYRPNPGDEFDAEPDPLDDEIDAGATGETEAGGNGEPAKPPVLSGEWWDGRDLPEPDFLLVDRI